MIVIQVQEASDPETAAAALERARADIANLDGGWQSAPGLSPQDRNKPKYVSGVVPAATGPVITIDGGFTPHKLLSAIPDLIALRLEEAGVSDAIIGVPKQGGPLVDSLGWGVLGQLERAVVLRLYPKTPRLERFQRDYAQIPDAWLREAYEWVGGTLGTGEDLAASFNSSIQFPITPQEIIPFLQRGRQARVHTALVAAGDTKLQVRAANGSFVSFEPNLALAGGGSVVGDAELIAIAERFKDVARRLAPDLAYAFISLEPSFRIFLIPNHANEWSRNEGGASINGFMEQICDEVVFEGFPYQILGPGHLHRLRGNSLLGRARTLAISRKAAPLPGGRIELAIGDLSSWIPGNPARKRAQSLARKFLAPCLLKLGEDLILLEARQAANE